MKNIAKKNKKYKNFLKFFFLKSCKKILKICFSGLKLGVCQLK